jgi:hypothetical protein
MAEDEVERRRGASRARALGGVCVLLLAAVGVASALADSVSGSRSARVHGPYEYGCPIFPANNPLNEEIAHAPVNPNSTRYIDAIGASGHLYAYFGANPRESMEYTVVGPHQPKVPIHITEYRRSSNPGPYPIPPSAPIEGAGTASDAHVLVLQRGTCLLYELYHAQRAGRGWDAGSGVIFNLRSNALRHEGFPSADAAGLPIFPLLARYPEVASGEIDHALRVTVERAQAGYIHPATHYSSESTDPTLPPMGLRLRLKASFDLTPFHGQALVILRALKRYGLIVADNGPSWVLTGAYNPGWNERDLSQLRNVHGYDFEAVDTGPIRHHR